jgi:hypothetical protein
VIVEFAIMLVGASGHATVNPVDVEPARDIGPPKLLILVKVTEMLPLLPEFMSEGAMLMAKSPTWMSDVVLWDAVPLIAFPVIVIWYVAGLADLRIHEAVEVELGVNGTTLVGQSIVKPAAGLVDELRLTEPAKLNVLVREIMMDVPVARALKLPELAEIPKSPMWTIAVVECDRPPGDAVPVTVTW